MYIEVIDNPSTVSDSPIILFIHEIVNLSIHNRESEWGNELKRIHEFNDTTYRNNSHPYLQHYYIV